MTKRVFTNKDEVLDRAIYYAEEAQKEANKPRSDSVTLSAVSNLSIMYSQLYVAMRTAENDSKPSN